jgi:AcrR family transcriptional regulator
VRDADRTRERILDAALVEFGEHGYAGARIGAIPARGSNQRLISYYFDGKAGLHRALIQRWRSTSERLNPSMRRSGTSSRPSRTSGTSGATGCGC